MPPPEEAGPSRPRLISYSSPSPSDEHAAHSALSANAAPTTVAGNKRTLDEAPSKRSKLNQAEWDEESRRRRREEAGKLFEFRKELPFYQGRVDILNEIMRHDTTIILGETGCGKSTQLPQLLRSHPSCRDHYRGKGPSIAITQPRRLPTIALAQRVAKEMGCPLGGEVGYSVRFEEAMGRETRVRYMTEGVLMRELANSSSEGLKPDGLDLLLRYDIIIIDEAHERTLNTDFLCGALKKIQAARKRLSQTNLPNGNGHAVNGDVHAPEVRGLKIVVMSATLDPSKFQSFFNTEALLVKGRVYDVKTRHSLEPVDDFVDAAARQALQIHSASQAGDILIFLPGSEEIESCVELLKRANGTLPEDALHMQVLPLYSALPPSAQAKIFAPLAPNLRRVVVSTNIAETSMTIPGVTYVIDTGYKKEKEYIYRRTGAVESLKRGPVSKAAAWQRTGRAGRERAGECFRLFTSSEFDKMQDYDLPEIKRANLASAVLQLVAMGQDPVQFDYIDPPGPDNISAALIELAGLSALASRTEITPLGTSMLRYPLDPPNAAILLSSFDLSCASEIIDIVSLINASAPVFVDRPNERESAAAARAKFVHRDGDHLTAMNAFRAYLAVKEQGQKSLGAWCRENHVNGKTLASAVKIRDQLRHLAEREGRDPSISCGSDLDVVGRCLLQGLFMNTALIQPDGSYKQTSGSLTVKIHPSSVLMSRKVPAILYDELTITSAFYARNVSAFDPNWLADCPIFKQGARHT